MRRVSKKRAEKMLSVREFRNGMIKTIGCCELCGASPTRPKHAIHSMNDLCVHEIANGPDREKALDKPYAILVLCWKCNSYEVVDKGVWPQARQLALLKTSRPSDYDLPAFNYLVNPRAPKRIEQKEVDQWLASL